MASDGTRRPASFEHPARRRRRRSPSRHASTLTFDQSLGTLLGMRPPTSITIDLPEWVWQRVGDRPNLASEDDRMALVIDLAEGNVADGGGPFAAAVFDESGTLIAPGVNRVVPSSAPIAHAEIVAIAMAGQVLGTWDLASAGAFELVTSTEPCAMCLGAVPWSGVRRMVCGARDEDARAVGFDEGHKPPDWVEHLATVGIEVRRDVLRREAAAVLRDYAAGGGSIYNGTIGGAADA